jgi:integrase
MSLGNQSLRLTDLVRRESVWPPARKLLEDMPWLCDVRHLEFDAANVRKMFKRVCRLADVGDGWTPRELRTSFVSLMSHHGVSIEEIAHLVGHSSTRTTEVVYRRELRPVITTGAEIMDEIFGLA